MLKGAYYNEIDPYAAQWLRNLISAGHIAPGDVDERSIEDVRPDDLHGYTQCHFFAGIGVWSYALRCAGWDDSQPVWTGSAPCQPFSSAGKGAGFADERHLWPAFFHLISECKPAIVFGEQVASKDADAWIDTLQLDLEAVGYAFGCVPFPSAGVGAPHIRDRLYWVADSTGIRQPRGRINYRSEQSSIGIEAPVRSAVREQVAQRGSAGWMGDSFSAGRQSIEDVTWRDDKRVESSWRIEEQSCEASVRLRAQFPGPTNSYWRDADWLFCRDGKWRPVEPGTFPLAHGAASRVGRLRAYGNAINAQAAKEMISAYLDWAAQAAMGE